MPTTTEIRQHQGNPTLYVNGVRTSPIAAYVGSGYLESFIRAGILLYTFSAPGVWWIGKNQYDFSAIDTFLSTYTSSLPTGCYLMPRIDLSRQGYPWWGIQHPGEMNVLRSIETGDILDQTAPNPAAASYLGHEVLLGSINLHSFHSELWRKEAGEAVQQLISYCESQVYADRLWGWHLCDGLFNEWFHWNEYSFNGMADYSIAAQRDFQRWLRVAYREDEDLLSHAWGKQVTFSTAAIPAPSERAAPRHGEFYDPVTDRPSIDYVQCFNDATADCILAICHSAKRSLPHPKVICVFYGYQFSNMPRPQLNGHYALRCLLDSKDVDLIASPHSYSNRGEGGYHSPQSMADSIRRAGKIHIDEIDCKTVWTPVTVTWKRHISQPKTIPATIEMMKKEAAYQLASATGQWWMDLTNQGWFDAPEAAETIGRLKDIEERLQTIRRGSFGEVALVVSQRSMMFQVPREGLHNFSLKILRNWHLSRMGAPFEQLLVDDLARSDLPVCKLYIFPNAFYLSAEERDLVNRVLERSHATALWMYAPGFLDERCADVENMLRLTGVKFGMEDSFGDLNVEVIDNHHPITAGLPEMLRYGTGIDRDQYLKPPKIQYMPDSAVSPAFFVTDPEAIVLGLLENTHRAGLVVKNLGERQCVYSAAPLLSWRLLRNIASWAGVHLYSVQGDMIWGNNAFLAVYSQNQGKRVIYFPRSYHLEDAWTGERYGQRISQLELDLGLWETRLLYTSVSN